jgi:hypothetical protein
VTAASAVGQTASSQKGEIGTELAPDGGTDVSIAVSATVRADGLP